MAAPGTEMTDITNSMDLGHGDIHAEVDPEMGEILDSMPPPAAESDSFIPPGAESSSSIPKGDKPAPTGPMFCGFLSTQYYQPYFNVTTEQILDRMKRVVVPQRFQPVSQPFEETVGEIPDAYGPLWICTTLVFAIGATANFCAWLDNEAESTTYDFELVVSAMGMVFAFVTLLPLGVWTFARFNGLALSLAHLVNLVSYSLLVFIPAALLCTVPSEAMDWTVMTLAVVWSLRFSLYENLWPTLQGHMPLKATVLGGTIVGAYVIFAMVLKVMFFLTF